MRTVYGDRTGCAAVPDRRDLMREKRAEYKAARKPFLVDVTSATCLVVTGKGPPQGRGSTFGTAIEQLFGVAYTLKFAMKADGLDFRVMPLETEWWAPGGSDALRKAVWRKMHWRAMVRVPPFVTAADVAVAKKALAAKGKRAPDVRRVERPGGRCIQALHVGPYGTTGPTQDAMRAFAAAQGYKFTGRHHEIYLSDPRRTAEARLRTILRHPVKKA